MTMKIPTGCMFTHIIRGSGKKISYQNAGVDCAFVGALSSGFCNWRIDFTYADTSSRNLPDLTRQDPQRLQDRPDAEQLSADTASLRQGVCPALRHRGSARQPVPPRHEVSSSMVEQQHQQGSDASEQARRRRTGVVGFLCGLLASLAFFAFFPGLPHVIDVGAIVVSVVVGVLTRWACLARWERRARRE
jgi:hypothetical protein